MPKNAVQRLQKIDSDVKNVISIYEVASKSKFNNDKSEEAKKQNSQPLPQNCTPKRLENSPFVAQFRKASRQSQTSLFDPLKKAHGFVAQPPKGIHSRESVPVNDAAQKKPGSAPAPSCKIATISESDYIWQQASDSNDSSEKGVLIRAKTLNNLRNPDWPEIGCLLDYEAVMTPSKTLQTANEILAKNNFIPNEKTQQNKSFPYESAPYLTAKDPEGCRTSGKQIACNTLDAKTTQFLMVSSNDILKLKPQLELQNEFVEMKTPVFSRNENSPQQALIGQIIPASATPSVNNNYLQENTSTALNGLSKKASPFDQSAKGNFMARNENKCFRSNSPIAESKAGERTEEKIKGKILLTQTPGDANVFEDNTVRLDEAGEVEIRASELFQIIEKSQAKLEKMKLSKEMALDIAKHLKEKYDEIQRSSENLLEKLQAAEKDNEKLTNEVKEARESKRKIQMKIEGSLDARARVKEQDAEIKDLKEEIFRLKSKMCAMENKHAQELLEQQKKIDEIQKERLTETRSGLKNNEILSEEVQRLSNEKYELLPKFNELRCQLQDRQTKIQMLEENIRQLEEEVQKQTQHLKIKTETLQETNRELEIIRQNSTELEEQVKTLRKNIENFERIQQDQLKQTAEYEKQVKSNQDEINELRNENQRLTEQLEKEKDGVRIKIKIIDDQQETIKQLKEKAEEAKNMLKKNQSLERILNIEREEKLELEEAVERLKWRKEELKKKIQCLENDFLLAPQEVVKDLQKTQIVLHELENQVQMKQKEWEMQLQSLVKEKEQACSVAEFATRKLMETTNEFQKQSKAYKSLQRIIAKHLAEKEQHVGERNKKAC